MTTTLCTYINLLLVIISFLLQHLQVIILGNAVVIMVMCNNKLTGNVFSGTTRSTTRGRKFQISLGGEGGVPKDLFVGLP